MNMLDPVTTRFVAGCVTLLLLAWMVRRRKHVTFRAWAFRLYFGDGPPPGQPE